MRKTPDRSRNAGAVILAIDLAQYCDNKGWHWEVSCERPGRDGHFSRTWDAPGRLSADAAADLTTWVAKCVNNALVVWGGIQEVLDVEA